MDNQKIHVFALKIAQNLPQKGPILPFFKNRSLDETRRSLVKTRRSLDETRRWVFGYCFINMAYRPLAMMNLDNRLQKSKNENITAAHSSMLIADSQLNSKLLKL